MTNDTRQQEKRRADLNAKLQTVPVIKGKILTSDLPCESREREC